MKTTKTTLTLAATAILFAAFAAEPTDAEKEAKRERMLRSTGGIIDVAPVGEVAVVNAQHKVDAKLIEALVAELAKDLRLNVSYRTGAFKMYERPAGVVGALVIADEPDLPMSVVAAEEVWGLVNVAKLVGGDKAQAEARFRREFVRGFALTFGQVRSQFVGSPCSLVRSPKDLDKLPNDCMTFDIQMLVQNTLADLGLKQGYRVSYRKACQQGWAQPPTNDYQKAVWEKVKNGKADSSDPTGRWKRDFEKK